MAFYTNVKKVATIEFWHKTSTSFHGLYSFLIESTSKVSLWHISVELHSMTCSHLLRRRLRQAVQRYVVVLQGILEHLSPIYFSWQQITSTVFTSLFAAQSFRKQQNKEFICLIPSVSVFKKQISPTICQLNIQHLALVLECNKEKNLWKIVVSWRNSTGLVKEFRLRFIPTKILKGKFPLTCKNVNEHLKFWFIFWYSKQTHMDLISFRKPKCEHKMPTQTITKNF